MAEKTGSVDGGLFKFQDLMDDFYGFEVDKDDDEMRTLKRGFQADMVKKFADSQIALQQTAQDRDWELK